MTLNARFNSNSCLLIADDDEDDQLMLVSAFRDIGFEGTLRTVSNGEEVLEYLGCQGNYSGSEMPRVIMLDLNMPKKDGRETLKDLRKNPEWARIPVIVYSTSANPEDVRFCYENGASSFISKPSSYQDLKMIAELIKRYWFDIVLIPAVGSC